MDDPKPKRWLVPSLLVVAVGLAILFTWLYPNWEIRKLPRKPSTIVALDPDALRMLEIKNQLRETASKVTLGVFGALALYFGWKRVKAADETNRVALQSQITERFTKAVEQLGTMVEGRPNVEVRLGGIYALERVAHDSPRDHWTIIEILTAYVRRNSTLLEDGLQTKVSTEVQAILTVLRRRNKSRDGDGNCLDLSNTNLTESILVDVEFEGIDLSEACLRGARLSRAHLEGADLARAHLEEADLKGAHLKGAFLGGAHLEGAILVGAHLEEAVLREAHLQGANLNGAHLEKAYLGGANLDGAQLAFAHLDGADLTVCLLTQQQLDSASGNLATQLPSGLSRPEHWTESPAFT